MDCIVLRIVHRLGLRLEIVPRIRLHDIAYEGNKVSPLVFLEALDSHLAVNGALDGVLLDPHTLVGTPAFVLVLYNPVHASIIELGKVRGVAALGGVIDSRPAPRMGTMPPHDVERRVE